MIKSHPKGNLGLLSRPVHGEFPWSPNRCAHTKQYLTQNFSKKSERITPRKSKKNERNLPLGGPEVSEYPTFDISPVKKMEKNPVLLPIRHWPRGHVAQLEVK